MNVHFPAPRPTWPGRLVNLAVMVVVVALAAATFVVSYPGLHAIVTEAGVSARLARIYPGLFYALFVVACVAAVMLRDGPWWARCYAWLVIILVVAFVGAAGAAHAMNDSLPHRTTDGIVAAAPWVLLLLAFSLMLTMLRQSRVQHAAPQAPATGSALALPASGDAPAEPETPAEPEWPVESEWVTEPEWVAEPEWAAEPQAAEEPEAPAAAEVPAAEEPEEPAVSLIPWPEAAPESAHAPDGEFAPDGESMPEPALAREAWPAAEAEQAPEAAAAPDGAQAAEAEAAADEGAPGDAGPGEEEPGPAPAPDEDHDGESEAAALPAYHYWDKDGQADSAGQDHPPTMPSHVVDDDAPPFATAPFATVPRLNRVRSTPTPPGEDEEE